MSDSGANKYVEAFFLAILILGVIGYGALALSFVGLMVYGAAVKLLTGHLPQ